MTTDTKPRGAWTGLSVLGLAPLFLTGCPGLASAEPNCMTRVLSDVPALEAPEQVESKKRNVRTNQLDQSREINWQNVVMHREFVLLPIQSLSDHDTLPHQA